MDKRQMVNLFGEAEIKPEDLRAAPKPSSSPKNKQPVTPVDWASWQPEKQYYPIGEVAALFAVRTSHIRFWTIEFALQVRTTQKGDRLYTPQNIQELRAIHHLVKERGFTIAGARARLKEESKAQPNYLDLKQSLLKLRNQLSLIRNKLV